MPQIVTRAQLSTVVSLKAIMVEGTGLCGGRRATAAGRRKPAYVDGPEFDGHQADFDELALRMKRCEREEREALRLHQERCHTSLSG